MVTITGKGDHPNYNAEISAGQLVHYPSYMIMPHWYRPSSPPKHRCVFYLPLKRRFPKYWKNQLLNQYQYHTFSEPNNCFLASKLNLIWTFMGCRTVCAARHRAWERWICTPRCCPAGEETPLCLGPFGVELPWCLRRLTTWIFWLVDVQFVDTLRNCFLEFKKNDKMTL